MQILRIALAVNALIKEFELLINAIEVTPINIKELQAVTTGLQELNELCKPEKT